MTHIADRTFTLSPLNEGHRVVDGQFVPGRQKRKVAIVGAGLGRHFAPLDDPAWEVWALNLIPLYDARGHLRASRWFDIHQREAQTDNDLRWIAKCPVPIYVPPDLATAGPNCVTYPLGRVLDRFRAHQFACTFSYQVALALLEGFTEIGFFGIELRLGTRRERTVEWASLSWWLGYATALGVNVVVPPGSWLGSHPKFYGFDYRAEIEAVDSYLDVVAGYDVAAKQPTGMGG